MRLCEGNRPTCLRRRRGSGARCFLKCVPNNFSLMFVLMFEQEAPFNFRNTVLITDVLRLKLS